MFATRQQQRKASGPHRRECGCHERVCIGKLCWVRSILLFLLCLQLALPRPHGALHLGASLRFTRSSLILPATSDHLRPTIYAAATVLPFLPCPYILSYLRVSPSRDRGNASTLYMSRHACSRLDLTYSCCSTLYSTSPVILTRTLDSHMEPARGTALSILTSIGSDMHECRLACKPMYMHHTHWSAGHPSSHPNVPSRFAKHQC